MRIRSYLSAAVAVVLTLGLPSATHANAMNEAFGREFGAFLDRLLEPPYAPPGVVVVAFDDRQILFERAFGVRDVRTGAPLTLDTPIYNASLTKSYTGVLAAQLDADGILPISARLTDTWPRITLQPPLDPAKVTMGALLSHSSGIYDEALEFQSNNTGEVDRKAIADHLSRYATPAPPFQYSNFGPFLYSTIAAEKSGESWHQGIRQRGC